VKKRKEENKTKLRREGKGIYVRADVSGGRRPLMPESDEREGGNARREDK
jgi:hypothetical protein